MALQKQAVNIPFGQGIDTKSDPNQVPIGKLLALTNSVFDKAGAFVKRNGFGLQSTLPNTEGTTITTFGDNLVVTGSSLYAYASSTESWNNRGSVQPVEIDAKSMVRTSIGQTSADAAVSSLGSVCITFIENSVSYYQVNDATTGQVIFPRVAISGTTFLPRVRVLGAYFIVTYLTGNNLNYIAVPITNPSNATSPTTISSQASSSSRMYDCASYSNKIYFIINGSDGGGAVRVQFLTSTLNISAATVFASHTADKASICIDESSSTIWTTWSNTAGTISYFAALDSNLNIAYNATVLRSGLTVNNLTGTASNGVFTSIVEKADTLGYSPNPTNNVLLQDTITISSGITSSSTVLQGVGLASKSLTKDNSVYVWTLYGSAYQPTYFLINMTGDIIAKLAYSNGRDYITDGLLPSVSENSSVFSMAYLFKDQIAPVNKNQGGVVNGGTAVAGLYSTLGVNLVNFSINTSGQTSAEIADSLHLTGGQLWQYDGLTPVEHGFHIWPENVAFTTSGGGSMSAQTYYYQVCYEWTDASGLIHRSAPSLPVQVVLTNNSVTLRVPTCKWTSKANVRTVIYRWSVAQQTYYQVTSITSPLTNSSRSTAPGYSTFVDTQSDAQIIGNTILYTTGGVLENIGAPSSIDTTLFKNRLWLVDAEDRNLLWFSKPIIDNTPVEMCDLQTVFVAPTSGGVKSTGAVSALASMDDKLIIFKSDGLYYLTGNGPDITGANNDFSDPVFITSTVGCTNLQSIVNTPMGVMFQSNKGIWILGRDLQTNYIGAPVEAYNGDTVVSGVLVPATNQVRFSLASGLILMYDYYYDQWGVFKGANNISSTIWDGRHTLLDTYGRVLKETPGVYLDVTQPVLLSCTSAWINVAGIQGYERFYQLLLLGKYFTPFTLNVQIAYDYNSNSTHSIQVLPDNYGATWGDQAQWGSGEAWGGPGNVFEVRLFPNIQKCESFQITINEVFDPSYGTVAGQGLSLSAMTAVVGTKKGYRTQKASTSFGGR
jgi:hypothetical protein